MRLKPGAGSRISVAKDEGRTPFPRLPLPGGKVKTAGHVQGIQPSAHVSMCIFGL